MGAAVGRVEAKKSIMNESRFDLYRKTKAKFYAAYCSAIGVAVAIILTIKMI